MKKALVILFFCLFLQLIQAKTIDYNISHWSYSNEITNGWSDWELKNVKMSINYDKATIYFHLNPISKYEIIEIVDNETYISMVATHDNIIVEIEIRRLSRSLAEMTIYYGMTDIGTPLGFRLLINDLQ